jgi:hypothetical protein
VVHGDDEAGFSTHRALSQAADERLSCNIYQEVAVRRVYQSQKFYGERVSEWRVMMFLVAEESALVWKGCFW